MGFISKLTLEIGFWKFLPSDYSKTLWQTTELQLEIGLKESSTSYTICRARITHQELLSNNNKINV